MRRVLPWLLVLVTVLTVAPSSAFAESPAWLVAHNTTRLDHTRTGMFVLAGWAGVNLVGGLAASFATTGRWQSFHQMNAGWNLVNLAIAGAGLWSVAGQDPNALGLGESVEAAFGLERMLWLNAGLDVGYVLLGSWLWERGARTSSTMLEGFGQSIVLQGAFLFVFDVALSAVTRFDNAALVPKLAPVADNVVGMVWGGTF